MPEHGSKKIILRCKIELRTPKIRFFAVAGSFGWKIVMSFYAVKSFRNILKLSANKVKGKSKIDEECHRKRERDGDGERKEEDRVENNTNEMGQPESNNSTTK